MWLCFDYGSCHWWGRATIHWEESEQLAVLNPPVQEASRRNFHGGCSMAGYVHQRNKNHEISAAMPQIATLVCPTKA